MEVGADLWLADRKFFKLFRAEHWKKFLFYRISLKNYWQKIFYSVHNKYQKINESWLFASPTPFGNPKKTSRKISNNYTNFFFIQFFNYTVYFFVGLFLHRWISGSTAKVSQSFKDINSGIVANEGCCFYSFFSFLVDLGFAYNLGFKAQRAPFYLNNLVGGMQFIWIYGSFCPVDIWFWIFH